MAWYNWKWDLKTGKTEITDVFEEVPLSQQDKDIFELKTEVKFLRHRVKELSKLLKYQVGAFSGITTIDLGSHLRHLEQEYLREEPVKKKRSK